jgi:hypothetical protein
MEGKANILIVDDNSVDEVQERKLVPHHGDCDKFVVATFRRRSPQLVGGMAR